MYKSSTSINSLKYFTARRYASAVYAVVVCPSVCLSVRPSQAGIVAKRLNVESRKQRRTMAQGHISGAKDFGEIPTGSPLTGTPNRGGVVQTAIFDQYLAISQKRCKIGA